ncbi:hypothetical protein IE53DRAFT_246348 [Violaceomyces palustris]|uniref:Uncharacterized protein n=1 Tax=Violaceomyces palustris TaxID=1673888 RepID=A0ACD0P452_9BASI|nr:hypothetical protein IE53DRAFT_246348 [Violaceomyces palustris]
MNASEFQGQTQLPYLNTQIATSKHYTIGAEKSSVTPLATSRPYDPEYVAIESSDTLIRTRESSGDGKRRRIWAACEPCRKRKSRCDGQSPCSGCVSTVRASSGSTGSPKSSLSSEDASMPSVPTTNEETIIFARAKELCVFDWNRKPRGPKGKKRMTGDGTTSNGTGSMAAGAPRSTESAGKAYVDAKQPRRSSADVRSNGDHDGKLRVRIGSGDESGAPDYWTSQERRSRIPTVMASTTPYHGARRISHQDGDAHHPLVKEQEQGSYGHFFDKPWTPGTAHGFDSDRRSDSSGYMTRASETRGRERSVSSIGLPAEHANSANGSIDSSWGGADSSSRWREAYRFGDYNGRRDHSLQSTNQVEQGLAQFDQVDLNESSSPFQHPLVSLSAVLGSDSPDSSDLRNGKHQQTPQPSQVQAPPGPYLDQLTLIRRLHPHYTMDDRPYVALAIAQFEALDSFTKNFPSRYLFGDRHGEGVPGPPNHLLIALLALLAHRALLLPGSQCVDDLDLEAGEVVIRCARNSGRLFGQDRTRMLEFARRSWNIAHELLFSLVSDGEIDPCLVQTGLLLDQGATEDGISTKTMAQMKMWLFKLVYSWRLHQFDAKDCKDPTADQEDWSEERVREELLTMMPRSEQGLSTYPEPRVGDARVMLHDPLETEAVRRAVQMILISAYWIQSAGMEMPKFEIYTMSVNPADADDRIHQGSNWTPRRRASNGYLLRTNHLGWRQYGRVTRMLHTPLLDLVCGRGPEPDLQAAISEMESTLDWIKGRVPHMTHDSPEMPLHAAAFLHSRICDLLQYRLFSAISSFYDLFPETSTSVPDPSIAAASTMAPHAQSQSGVLLESVGGTSDGLEGEAKLTSGFSPRPRFSRHPMMASLAPLWEVGAVVKRLLAKWHARGRTESSNEVKSGEVGTATGQVMDDLMRSYRWPRHLRIFAQHAYAMAAEVHVASEAWVRLDRERDPTWIIPPSFRSMPALDSPELEAGLWDIGDSITELLFAMSQTGSTHARDTAELVTKYKEGRRTWALQQGRGR